MSRSHCEDLIAEAVRKRQHVLLVGAVIVVARQILGSVLGFQSKGILGYIIRFIVYRYGWSILRVIFGRLFRT